MSEDKMIISGVFVKVPNTKLEERRFTWCSRYRPYESSKGFDLVFNCLGVEYKREVLEDLFYVHRSLNMAFKNPKGLIYHECPYYLARNPKSDWSGECPEYSLVIIDLDTFIGDFEGVTLEGAGDCPYYLYCMGLNNTQKVYKPVNFETLKDCSFNKLCENPKKYLSVQGGKELVSPETYQYYYQGLINLRDKGAMLKIYPKESYIFDSEGVLLTALDIYSHQWGELIGSERFLEINKEFKDLLSSCFDQRRRDEKPFHIVVDGKGYRKAYKEPRRK